MRSKTSSLWISHPLSVALTMNLATLKLLGCAEPSDGGQASGRIARHWGRRGMLPYALGSLKRGPALCKLAPRKRPGRGWSHLGQRRAGPHAILVVKRRLTRGPLRLRGGRIRHKNSRAPAGPEPANGAGQGSERAARVSVKLLYSW